MKEKIIETAGKTWKALGQKGELLLEQLPKAVNVDEATSYQALGWLAREDKINYSIKNKQTFVSLVDSELRAFKNLFQLAPKQTTAAAKPSALSAAQSPAGKKKSKS